MTISIDVENTNNLLDFDYEAIINKAIIKSLDFMKCPYECEVNVLITDNESIRKINKDTRDIDKATDVLSFPMIEYEKAGEFTKQIEDNSNNFNLDTGELLLGDIVLSQDKIIEQAKAYGHTPTRELAFLVVHSILHLLGYDHIIDEDRIVMEEKQRQIMSYINILR